MHCTSDKYLLQIEPRHDRGLYPVEDELTVKMWRLLQAAKIGAMYRGWHTCICGQASGSADLIVGPYITNSLAGHYLVWHRGEVPESEIDKLRRL